MSGMMKNFICFPKEIFFSKWFHRYDEFSFDRPAKLFLPNYWKWSEKRSTKDAKIFEKVFSKKFLWRGREQLESPAHIFWQPAEFFPLDFQKITVCKVSNRISPEKFPWNWESSLTTSLVFSENWSKISLSVQKGKKKLRTKLLFVKMFYGTIRMQF